MTSTVGRLVVDVLTNQSGGSVALGDVVYVDTAHDTAFTTGTTSGYLGMVGVVIEANGIASAATGRIQFSGHCAQVNLNASGTRGNFIKTFTVAKQATDAGASRVAGAFGQILVTGTTPPVELFGFPDGSTGSAGSPGTPAVTLSTTNSTGVAVTLIATDATIAVFDATVPAAVGTAAAGSAAKAARRDHVHNTGAGTPSTQAFGDSASTGSGPAASMTDHKHAMMAASASAPGTYESYLSSDLTCVSSNTLYSVASLAVTPAAGDYLIIIRLAFTSASALATGVMGMIATGGTLSSNVLSGHTAIADSYMYNPASNAGGGQTIIVMARVTVDGSTLVRAVASSSRTSSDTVIKTTGILTGATANKGSSITATKITSL